MTRILRQIPGVVGVYVEGPFHDEKSDIDMAVIYDEKIVSKAKAEGTVHRLLKKWLEEREKKTGKAPPHYFRMPFLYSIQNWRKDLQVRDPFLDIKKDINLSHWWDGERWEDLNLIVLFDQTGEIREHIEEVRKCSPNLFLKRAELSLKKINFFIDGIYRNLERGDMLSALYNLTQAITGIVHALYAVNLQHCPYEKWSLHYIARLSKKPKNLKEKVTHILTVPSITKTAIETRTKTLRDLANWLKEETNKVKK